MVGNQHDTSVTLVTDNKKVHNRITHMIKHSNTQITTSMDRDIVTMAHDLKATIMHDHDINPKDFPKEFFVMAHNLSAQTTGAQKRITIDDVNAGKNYKAPVHTSQAMDVIDFNDEENAPEPDYKGPDSFKPL